jgi:hypothetical protein
MSHFHAETVAETTDTYPQKAVDWASYPRINGRAQEANSRINGRAQGMNLRINGRAPNKDPVVTALYYYTYRKSTHFVDNSERITQGRKR